MLLVHGRDFKPRADDWLDICIASIAAGIERDFPDSVEQFGSLNKRLAYYGDITDKFLTSQGLRYDEVLVVGDRRNALVSLKSISKKKNFGVNRYDRLPGKTAVLEFAADVVAPILGRLGLSKRLLNNVGVDLAEYWQEDGEFAGQLRSRVRQALCAAFDADKNIILVSHGTDCIVTYDVLWELSHDPEFAEAYGSKKVDLWLTLGAPLGDAMVQKRIHGAKEGGVRCYPTNVVSWHNISAENDFVSHDNTLADDFNKMMTQHQVSCIRDYRIYNMAVRYGKSNPHSSSGYLIHPRTAQIIVEWLQKV
ncbi:MAG: hypothetical protein HOI35_13215 [Woeseia sp.]|nr:hypothetical protein [Woeseia sp.]MBT6210964.1 hypothetical protein [Woeseia sp.]